MRSDIQRVLIIGNSGSGKSWLAMRLAEKIALPVTDLDTLNWEPGGYGKARAKEAVLQDALAIARESRWIIEGVYGWIAEKFAKASPVKRIRLSSHDEMNQFLSTF